MGGGIFRRLVVTYAIIIAVIIGVLAIALSQYFRVYFFQTKQRELLNIGRQVETQLIKFRRGDIAGEELVSQVNTIGRAANSRIIILERDSLEKGLAGYGLDNELINMVEEVFAGREVVRKRQFAAELDTFVVAVGIPVPGDGEERKDAAVLLFSPVYEVDTALSRVYQIILLTAAGSFAVGLVLVWITAGRMTRPLITLSRMAEEIAGGRKVADIPGETDDEIGRLTGSFNYMKNRLAAVDQMRQEFIAAVSHELRTPLTSVRGFIQGILDGVIKPAEQEKYLNLAFSETNRLARLTDDLLELTKLEAGAVRLNRQEVLLGQLVEDSVMTVLRNTGQGRSRPKTEIPPGLSLKADPDRLKQVLINLLTNAFKYTPEDGEITIRARITGGNTEISVIDTGAGIPAAELPYIFEKFYRVDKSRDSAAGGTGLGLSIVRNLVELHGGEIKAESAEGSGARFIIRLPVN